MSKMRRLFHNLIAQDLGTDLVEYSVIACSVVLALVVTTYSIVIGIRNGR
jgi:Flp pilus assembly pilin Flp